MGIKISRLLPALVFDGAVKEENGGMTMTNFNLHFDETLIGLFRWTVVTILQSSPSHSSFAACIGISIDGLARTKCLFWECTSNFLLILSIVVLYFATSDPPKISLTSLTDRLS